MQRRKEMQPGKDAAMILKCGGRAQRRHRFGTSTNAVIAAWRFASRRTPNSLVAATPRCSAIRENQRAPRGFFRSADSFVHVFPPHRYLRADKAVRAPLVAALPRYAFALKMK
jgi:hypothetical protein